MLKLVVIVSSLDWEFFTSSPPALANVIYYLKSKELLCRFIWSPIARRQLRTWLAKRKFGENRLLHNVPSSSPPRVVVVVYALNQCSDCLEKPVLLHSDFHRNSRNFFLSIDQFLFVDTCSFQIYSFSILSCCCHIPQ